MNLNFIYHLLAVKKLDKAILQPEGGSENNDRTLTNECLTSMQHEPCGTTERTMKFATNMTVSVIGIENYFYFQKIQKRAALERQSPTPLKGMTKPCTASAKVGCQVSTEPCLTSTRRLVQLHITVSVESLFIYFRATRAPVELQRSSQKPQTSHYQHTGLIFLVHNCCMYYYLLLVEPSNTVFVIVLRKRDTPLILQLIYSKKYMGTMGKQRVYRKLTREHNGNKMIVYDVIIQEELQISSSEYNKELRKISAECPTPHLVIFSFPLTVAISSQRDECLTFFNINNAFKKCGWTIWKYSMFVLTHSPLKIDYEVELKKRKNSIKWGLERRHICLEELNVVYMYQSITDHTSRKGSSLLSSFWDTVFAKCDTTTAEILEEFTST